MDVFDAPDLVDRQDSRVVDCRRGPGFLHEAADAIRLSRESVGQDLERNLAVELRIEGEMDFSHSTRCNWSNDLVMTEPVARRDGDGEALLNVREAVSLAFAIKSCKRRLRALRSKKQIDNSVTGSRLRLREAKRLGVLPANLWPVTEFRLARLIGGGPAS